MSMFTRKISVLLGLLALPCGGGCAHFQGEPRALYAGPVLPPAETALLSGYVAKVDDVDVSHLGGPFALLPGCHVITSRDKLGDNSPSGAWSVVMPQLTFPVRMQAGHVYEVQAQRQGSGSETANLKMRVVELDGSGTKLGEVAASHSKADLEACRAWEAEQANSTQPTKDEAASGAKAPAPQNLQRRVPTAAEPKAEERTGVQSESRVQEPGDPKQE